MFACIFLSSCSRTAAKLTEQEGIRIEQILGEVRIETGEVDNISGVFSLRIQGMQSESNFSARYLRGGVIVDHVGT